MSAEIRTHLTGLLARALATIAPGEALPPVGLERPKQAAHGDFACNVALALAKHRLMTAKFDYQQLRPLSAEDVARNPNGTWLSSPSSSGRESAKN